MALSIIHYFLQFAHHLDQWMRNWFYFFFSCLFHFDLVLLQNDSFNKDKQNTNKKFLKKYFNFNKCNNKIVYGARFYGIETSNICSFDCILYNIIDTIMKQPYFNGLSQMRSNKVCIYVCLCLHFVFIALLFVLLPVFWCHCSIINFIE